MPAYLAADSQAVAAADLKTNAGPFFTAFPQALLSLRNPVGATDLHSE